MQDGPAAQPGTTFSQPIRAITTMLLVCILVGAGAWAIHAMVIDIIRTNPLLNGLIAFVFLFGVADLLLAGLDPGAVGQLDRELRPSCPRRRHRRAAAPAGAAGLAFAVARIGADDDLGLVRPVDPGIGRAADGRGARHHPLSDQPAGLPGPSGHLLGSGHHGSGGGRHHPQPGPGRRRKRASTSSAS
jgi:hypothetical protein